MSNLSKKEIIEELKKAGIKFNPNDKKEVLEALLSQEQGEVSNDESEEKTVDEDVSQSSEELLDDVSEDKAKETLEQEIVDNQDDSIDNVETKEDQQLFKGATNDFKRFADLMIEKGSEGFTLPESDYGRVTGVSFSYTLIPPSKPFTKVETKACNTRIMITVFKQKDFYNELLRLGQNGYKMFSYSSSKIGSGFYQLSCLVEEGYDLRASDRYIGKI